MDKEAQEKVADYFYHHPDLSNTQKAYDVVEIMEAHRKLEGKPPLLSDEEIAQVYHTKSKPSLMDTKGILHPDYERAFCQAQRDSDIEWYKGQ